MASIQHFPIGELVEKGLLLQSALPIARLEQRFVDSLVAAGVDLQQFKTLVLMGQAGPLLFDDVVSNSLDQSDPFDSVSVSLVTEWFTANVPHALFEVLYPGPNQVPLGQLAEVAGWGKPSPLGLTIHADYGLWLAHRVAFLTDVEWDYREPERSHPCDTCVLRQCESACPVGAVSFKDGFDVGKCSGHRAPEGSQCAHECLARNACPVGEQHRYGPVQMHHHYSSGLKSIREWLS